MCVCVCVCVCVFVFVCVCVYVYVYVYVYVCIKANMKDVKLAYSLAETGLASGCMHCAGVLSCDPSPRFTCCVCLFSQYSSSECTLLQLLSHHWCRLLQGRCTCKGVGAAELGCGQQIRAVRARAVCT